MMVLVAFTLLWSAFALNFAKSAFEVPPTIIRALEPVQHWLVSHDVESVQLTNSELEEQTPKPTKAVPSVRNLVVIQIVDKLFFVIFIILTFVLHN